MRAFTCTRCNSNVFFENTQCGHCGSALGYAPSQGRLLAFDPTDDAAQPWTPADGNGAPLHACANRLAHNVCNWMLDEGEATGFCASCRLNETIPDLSVPGNLQQWAAIEQAKRQMLYMLLAIGLKPTPKSAPDDRTGLAFRFLAPLPDGSTVLTGHADGVITLNLREADDVHREATRAAFGEPWRTLLGHLRHEVGHYLHARWVAGDAEAEAVCRDAFGDERNDYASALAQYHAQGPVLGWEARHISAYASAHPSEDWAECCAHLLLVLDAVETAGAWGLSLHSRVANAEPAPDSVNEVPAEQLVLLQWLPIAQFLNAMNRSLGLRDSYPFLLNDAVLHKLGVVGALLRRAAHRASAPASAEPLPQPPQDSAPLPLEAAGATV